MSTARSVSKTNSVLSLFASPCSLIFKLILAAYLLLELLPNDATCRWYTEATFISSEEESSKLLINGKVLRVLVFDVYYFLNFIRLILINSSLFLLFLNIK